MRVSSPVTKHNPRPRKYASAAARQAAYRARNEMLEFRAEPNTAETLTRIADTIDVSRSDLLLSMVKFALANHDWARFGLTHKTIPYYQGNPIMRFIVKKAEGTTSNGRIRAIYNVIDTNDNFVVDSFNLMRDAKHFADKWNKETHIMATKKPTPAQLAARAQFAEMARSGAFKKKRKANPRKKTVSQKVSQLVHEGYPQRQAVAVALSEQRAGKVKRNPTAKAKTHGKVSAVVLMKNPVMKMSDLFAYIVHPAGEKATRKNSAYAESMAHAKAIAQSWADMTGKQYTVMQLSKRIAKPF